jgi:hypothetical protein
MKNITKTLIGGSIGFGIGCYITAARLTAATIAPIAYPIFGCAVGVTTAMVIAEKGKASPTKLAISAVGGVVIGTVFVPLAITEPVMAPLAIPICTAIGSYIGNRL